MLAKILRKWAREYMYHGDFHLRIPESSSLENDKEFDKMITSSS